MQIKRRRYIQFTLALLALAIIGGTMLVNSPRVQQRVSVILATELENRIGTRVSLGGVHWLFPSDIVIDSLAIDDQEGEQVLSIASVAAKVEWMPLIRHRQLSIRNIRLFHPHIAVYKATPEEEANYQFLIDAFAAKKERKKPSRLNLRINSLLIRHARVKYDIHSAEKTPGRFNAQHIAVDDLSAHLSLKALTPDTLSAMIRHLDMKEQSGLQVDGLYMRLVGNRQGATLANFRLDLPHSTLQLDTIWASYPLSDNRQQLTAGTAMTAKPLHRGRAWGGSSSFIIKGRTLPSHITPADLGSIVPELKGLDEKVYLHADVIGSPDRINLKALDIHTSDRDLAIMAKGTALLDKPSNTAINIDLQKADLTTTAWTLLADGAPEIYKLIPQELIRIGGMATQGSLKIEDGHTTLDLQAITDAGDIKAHLQLDPEGRYTTTLDGKGIGVAQVIPTSPLTQTDLALTAKGRLTPHPLGIQNSEFTATATHTSLLGYEYQAITLDGSYSPEAIGATVTLDDPNGKLRLQAMYDTTGETPRYTAHLTADSLDLHTMNLIGIHEGRSFSARLIGDIQGHDLNHMMGNIKIDSLTMHREGDDYTIRSIALYSFEEELKSLSLNSDFMNMAVKGDFTYETLASSLMGHLHDYLPSLCTSHSHSHKTNNNQCLVTLEVTSTQPLQELLLMPVSIDKKASAVAQLYDNDNKVDLSVNIPQLTYNDNNLESIGLECNAYGGKAEIQAHGTLSETDDNTRITAQLTATAKENRVNLGSWWTSNPTGLFSGTLSTDALFARNEQGELEVTVQTDSALATINHSLWNLHPFEAHIAPEHTCIRNFRFEHNDTQYLDIDGTISDTHTDTLNVKVNDLDLDYLLSLVKLQGISFGGHVSGDIKAADLYSETPFVDANVEVKRFAFCDGEMGDAVAHAYWNQDSTRLQFIAKVNETPDHTTVVDGYADLAANELWIDIAADSTNVSFLNTLLQSFMNDISGHASGHLTVGGPMKAIDLTGALMADVDFNLTPTNVHYRFADTLRFAPGQILFNGIEARDNRDQKGIVNGIVTHNYLKDFGHDLYVDAQNILGIDLPDTGNDSFYTTIYGTGEVRVLGGPGMPLQIDINALPEAGSVFALNLNTQDMTSSEGFITFVDRQPQRNTPTTTQTRRTRGRRQATTTTPLVLNINTTVTPDATLKLVMNQATDDHISVRGSGELKINVVDDDIDLFGTFTASRGSYTLNLQNLINKRFDVVEGSTVNFDGEYTDARFNITACHVVNQAPLRDLNPEAKNNALVNCLIKIGGTLGKPTLAFDLELPQGTEEEKAILRSFTSTEEQMNLQFIYLLGLSKFYTMDMASAGAVTEGMSGMESLLTSTISNQINNLISNIIHSDNWNIASNIRTNNAFATDVNTWENMEIGGILEGRMLNNKLLINGNFSYRENPMYASNFIGDFDVRYLLTNALSVKGYNKTNDRYFTKTALTTQGIGLLFQRDFERLFPTRKKQPLLPTPTLPDSITTR